MQVNNYELGYFPDSEAPGGNPRAADGQEQAGAELPVSDGRATGGRRPAAGRHRRVLSLRTTVFFTATGLASCVLAGTTALALMMMSGPGSPSAGAGGAGTKASDAKTADMKVTGSGATRMNAASAARMAAPGDGSAAYQFTTLDDPADPAFNQLLGINNRGRIAGYFGSGAAGQPNMGYLLTAPAQYQDVSYPGSAQTQVTGLNDQGVRVGFWSAQNNADQAQDADSGFYLSGGVYHDVNFPTSSNASPQVSQLLGVNDHDVAVGFYADAQGRNRGYEYSITTHQFTRVQEPGTPPGAAGPSLTAAAINGQGDVAGFYTDSGGVTVGFLKTAAGRFITLAVPGASATQALGVNDSGEVAGGYLVGTGNAAVMHGFTWTAGRGFATIDDPAGAGGTTVNGINDNGELAGFYTDAQGSTHGLLAAPRN